MLDCIWFLIHGCMQWLKRIWFFRELRDYIKNGMMTGASTRISIMNSCLLSWVANDRGRIEAFHRLQEIPLSMNKLAPLINIFWRAALTRRIYRLCVWSCASGNGSGSGSLVKDIHWIPMPNASINRLSSKRDSDLVHIWSTLTTKVAEETMHLTWKLFPWNKRPDWCYGTSPRNHLQDGWNALRYTHQNVSKMFASLFVRRLNGR